MEFPERKRLRLSGHDYSLSGGYFITICTKDRIPWFGKIANKEMVLSEAGKKAYECWLDIPNHFPMVCLDQSIVMPDHIHGIIFLNNFVGADDDRPVVNRRVENFRPLQKAIPSIVRGFKIGVTKWCHANNCPDFAWHRSFHDRIIRTEGELERIRHYIFHNPHV